MTLISKFHRLAEPHIIMNPTQVSEHQAHPALYTEMTEILDDLPVSHEGGETGGDPEREVVVVRVQRRLRSDEEKYSLQWFSDYF